MREFVRPCLHCADTRSGDVPRPLGETVHGTAPNEVVHFDYLYVGESGLCELTPGAAAGIAPGPAADGTAGAATGTEAVVELASTCTVRCGAAQPNPDREDLGLFFEA